MKIAFLTLFALASIISSVHASFKTSVEFDIQKGTGFEDFESISGLPVKLHNSGYPSLSSVSLSFQTPSNYRPAYSDGSSSNIATQNFLVSTSNVGIKPQGTANIEACSFKYSASFAPEITFATLSSISMQLALTDSSGILIDNNNYVITPTITLVFDDKDANNGKPLVITLDSVQSGNILDVNFDFSSQGIDLSKYGSFTATVGGNVTNNGATGSTLCLGVKDISVKGAVQSIPEPSTATLSLLGFGSLLLRRRRKV